ncbi:hypothetical protein BDV28DRAFT_151521 [Aspergillus coremiiformis]|uniref:TM7S3/TM198-like domain-containing protein n=1 Tax=Aspergillus coremiiformis TaxID=138285 RepID=A0A5N6YWK2_9EURO|nr:hypothetical protein BDV28DRAFT_151521 [Aspergillus coremiiformis]
MRLFPLLVLLSCLVSCLFVFAARIPHARRNEYGGIAIIEARATEQVTTTTANLATGMTSSVTSHATASIDANPASNTTMPATTTTATLATSLPTGNETNSTAHGTLPLQPKITPAVGIGGFLLIVAGAVLAITGIRNLWIQVFLSTAFLASIGIIVLIVYVMSPPVRVAVQGAYLVAIFSTGVTFGALSLIFRELTEGLACLLGGFCSSMWLLSLKPGGLLTQTGAKGGFIGAISVAFYALSFSHYTKPYGLMVSTGISGGTAVALGIDCFSRAGWKEFWLYIWALNDGIFPPGTSTYPVTRNIRVELAAAVIIAVLGVISQLRLWKVIRERRQKETEIREKEQKDKKEGEIENGRRFEEKNMEERLEWEARYDNPNSGIPELADNSKNRCSEVEAGNVEKGGAADMISITSSSQESYRCSDCLERRANGESAYASSDTSGDTGDSQTRQHEDTTVDVGTEDLDQSSPDKKTVPLKVFDGAAAAQIKDDNSSDMTAIVGSEEGTTCSKRLSGRELLDRMSARNSARLMSHSQEALVSCDGSSTQDIIDGSSDSASDDHSIATENHVEEQNRLRSNSKASLVASGAQEMNGNEMAGLEKDAEKSAGAPSVYSRGVEEQKFCVAEQDGNKGEKDEDAGTKGNAGQRRQSLLFNQEKGIPGPQPEEQSTKTPQSEIRPEQAKPADQGDGPQVIEFNVNGSGPEGQDEEPVEASQPSESVPKEKPPTPNDFVPAKRRSSTSEAETKIKPKKEVPARLDAETVNQLPQRTSKVVQSYRTNEWAKHLDDAEAPEPEPIEPVEEDEPELPDEVNEIAAPVIVEELLQTPLNAQPPPAIDRRASLGKGPSGTNDDNQITDVSRVPLSCQTKKRISSGSSVLLTSNIARSASPEIRNQPVQGAPDVDNVYNSLSPVLDPGQQPREAAEAAAPQWKGPLPLIAVREGMMRNRLSSFSLNTDPRASRLIPGAEVCSRHSTLPFPEEADDMPLSRRRVLLHQQSSAQPNVSQAPMRRSAPNPLNTPAALAAWRGSFRANVYDRRDPAALQPRMTIPGAGERNRTLSRKPRGRDTSVKIENAIAEGMQRGDMTELHRQAMRRMQATANRGVNGK